MKTLVIPDIHNFIGTADHILKQEECDKVVFLGDYFDNIGDNENDVEKTAWWLKGIIHNPKYHFIMGNHDVPYRWPNNPNCKCPGWTPRKSAAVNRVLKKVDWDVMRFLIVEQNFWLSHAGMRFSVFETKGSIDKWYCKRILDLATSKLANNQFAWEISDRLTGLVWVRFSKLHLIPGVSQIVGHTSDDFVRIKKGPSSFNVCLDTMGAYYVVIDNGEFYYVNRMTKERFDIHSKQDNKIILPPENKVEGPLDFIV